MKAKLAAFAKTPELSPVKTRLASDLGKTAAEEIYGRSLLATAAVMRALPEWISPVWALAEPDAPAHPRWANAEFPAMFTGEGGLGERLANVYDALRGEKCAVILIGADSPQLSPQIAESAAKSALSGKTTIGPSPDGGFYLFASAQSIPREAWTSVQYSAPSTLRDLQNRLPSTQTTMLPELWDIDDLPSLRRAALDLQSAPLPEQREMAKWLAARFPL